MSNMKRKNRSNTGRSPRARGPERSITAEGIYNNSHFMHAITSHVGNVIQIQTLNGSIFEGIFRTFSSHFDVVLEMAHKIDPNDPKRIVVDEIADKLIFKAGDIVTMTAVDADLEYATRDTFQTDAAISKFNGQIGERELEPWDGPGCNGDDFDLDGATANGWDVNDMFRKNEQMYGVQSTFDHSMPGYTMQLQKRDTKDYKDAEAKATKIANEIENNPAYKVRMEVENGGDEEERFAAVVRPASENTNNNNNIEVSKPYVPPAKRKNPQSGKVVRNNNTAPQTSSAAPIITIPNQKPSYLVPSTTSSTPYHHVPTQFPPAQQQTVTHHQQSPTTLSSQPPVVTSASTPTYSNVQQALPQREPRVNGQVDPPPPKAQRPTSNLRTGRSYPVNENSNNIGPRYQANGAVESGRNAPAEVKVPAQTHHNTMIQPSQPVPQHQPVTPTQLPNHPPPVPPVTQVQHGPPITHHSHSAPFPSVSTQPAPAPQTEQRKSPVTDQQNNNSNMQQRKVPRGREEQLSDLKKFGSDFKLGETNPEEKKTQPVSNEVEQRTSENKDQSTAEVDKVTSTLKKSTLNPNAKEFIYAPTKTFTPRSPSTPTPSRPHTPQTPSYGPGPALPAMVLPTTYVVTTGQPAFNATPNQGNRYRKVQMAMSHRPDIASQMQVAAATGQPLLAPAPMHTQFTVPYSAQGHLPPQPYQQMVRMVAQQGGGMVPLVPTSLNYHHDSTTQQTPQIQYMSPAGMAPPHPHHPHHHTHPPPNAAPSPGQTGAQTPQGVPGHTSTGGYHHTPQSPASNYPQPPPPPPQGPHPPNGPPTHAFPIMYPVLPAPPPPPGPHNPHHMMAAAAQGSMQQYIHHHHQHPQVGSQQPPHIQVILPHSQ